MKYKYLLRKAGNSLERIAFAGDSIEGCGKDFVYVGD
jgi:hypothetical protein